MRACSAALLAGLPALALAQNTNSPEAMVGSIDAVVFICGPVEPKTAKDGAEMLARLAQQHKLDLPAVRKSPPYAATYNAEVNRLLALPVPRRAEACKNVF